MLHNMKAQKSENLWATNGCDGLRRLKRVRKEVIKGVTMFINWISLSIFWEASSRNLNYCLITTNELWFLNMILVMCPSWASGALYYGWVLNKWIKDYYYDIESRTAVEEVPKNSHKKQQKSIENSTQIFIYL